jgi:hypothetical protein
MLETSIAYLLSMEWGRDIIVPPSSSFTMKEDKGDDVRFFVTQANWEGDHIKFVPFGTSNKFVVFFIWGKDGDNCVTIPTAYVQDEIGTGVLSASHIAKSLIHKVRIDVSSDLLPSGNDFVYQRQAKV